MTINSVFSHWKWWFSIAMLNYQRVTGRAELLQPSNLSPCIWQLHHPPGKTPPEFGPEDPEFRWAKWHEMTTAMPSKNANNLKLAAYHHQQWRTTIQNHSKEVQPTKTHTKKTAKRHPPTSSNTATLPQPAGTSSFPCGSDLAKHGGHAQRSDL